MDKRKKISASCFAVLRVYHQQGSSGTSVAKVATDGEMPLSFTLEQSGLVSHHGKGRMNFLPCTQKMIFKPYGNKNHGVLGGYSKASGTCRHLSVISSLEPQRQKKKAKKTVFFEVLDTSPPPQALGIVRLPKNTHNGDMIEIDGRNFVVQSVTTRYRLLKGRYIPDRRRLEVQTASRLLYNE